VKPSANGKARIFLADDHQAILDRASDLLDGKFELVGQAQNGKAALEKIESIRPDILVVDIGMPVLDGIRVMQQLQKTQSPVKVIFLTVQQDSDYVSAAFRYGARAYVTKPRMSSDLVPAIEEVLAGRTFVSSTLSLSGNGKQPNLPD
jgi:DNA-binding NarL/FixJ family response regulator